MMSCSLVYLEAGDESGELVVKQYSIPGLDDSDDETTQITLSVEENLLDEDTVHLSAFTRVEDETNWTIVGLNIAQAEQLRDILSGLIERRSVERRPSLIAVK